MFWENFTNILDILSFLLVIMSIYYASIQQNIKITRVKPGMITKADHLNAAVDAIERAVNDCKAGSVCVLASCIMQILSYCIIRHNHYL